MSIPLIAFLVFAAVIIGLGKGGLGSAFAGVITPIASIFMPVPDAIAYLLPLLIVGDWLALPSYWGKWNKEQLRLMFPPAILGLIAGTYLLANLSSDALRIILGVLTLIVAFYKLLEKRLQRMQYHYHPWHGRLAGALSGIGSALANAGGLTFTSYLLLIRIDPIAYIASSAIFFAVLNLLRLPGLVVADLFDGEKMLQIVWFIPLVFVGVRLGHWLIHRINPAQFERLMTVILIVAGLILLLR